MKVAANDETQVERIAAIQAELARRDREGEPDGGPQFWRKGHGVARDVISTLCTTATVFTPTPAPSAPPAASTTPTQATATVAALVEMGFDATPAAEAVAATGGSVDAALAYLLK